MRPGTRHLDRTGQRGFALILMLALLIAGAAVLIVSRLSAPALRSAQQQTTSAAMAKAKETLLGYALVYGDTHAGQVPGYLPCPDSDASNGEGGAKLSCGGKNVSAIGRLPWKTLDIDTQRDGNGECLWYALSGSFKNNPKTDFMNWDTPGQLEIADSHGNNLVPNAIAVVFAPGPAQAEQSRLPNGSAPVCGGNYTATAYLDKDAALALDNAAPSATAHATSRFVASSASPRVNDQLAFITAGELFERIKRRNDFPVFVATLLANATSCLTALPNPVNINFDTLTESTGASVGNLIVGRIPYTACSDNTVRQWRDNLLYAKCTSGTCRINGADCGKNGIAIFTGERNADQPRLSNADKNDWANYLEGNALAMFSTGSSNFAGVATAYNPASPSTDVAACIP